MTDRTPCTLWRAAAALALLLAACTPARPGEPVPAGTVPARGADSTLDVAAWNIEWLGHDTRGPDDEALQVARAAEVIRGLEMDLWGVEEIVGPDQWQRLLARLPGYEGILASDPGVAQGAAFYGAEEQKVGIIYRRAAATPVGARLILTEHDYDVGRRPPLEVLFRLRGGGELAVIVMHAKSSADSTSWQRRRNAGRALQAHLESAHASRSVLVIGDWNDDVDASITPGLPTPYAGLVADSARYLFPTGAISAQHISSMAEWPEMIDHHMAAGPIRRAYLPGSAEVFRADRYIPGYVETTSDHFPVITRYRWP